MFPTDWFILDIVRRFPEDWFIRADVSAILAMGPFLRILEKVETGAIMFVDIVGMIEPSCDSVRRGMPRFRRPGLRLLFFMGLLLLAPALE